MGKNKEKKCFLIRGARQVGKSFIIEQIAKENYEEVLFINYKETLTSSQIFIDNLNVDIMVRALRFRFPLLSVTPEKQ